MSACSAPAPDFQALDARGVVNCDEADECQQCRAANIRVHQPIGFVEPIASQPRQDVGNDVPPDPGDPRIALLNEEFYHRMTPAIRCCLVWKRAIAPIGSAPSAAAIAISTFMLTLMSLPPAR